jgi:hypothetical protein
MAAELDDGVREGLLRLGLGREQRLVEVVEPECVGVRLARAVGGVEVLTHPVDDGEPQAAAYERAGCES